MRTRIVIITGGDRNKAVEYVHSYGRESVEIVAIITPIPTEKNNRFVSVIKYANKESIPCVQAEYNALASILKDYEYDILVSLGWPRIISEDVIQLSKHAVNVHPTLLPKYRGFRSAPFILINGERESGVSVHFIEKELDRGDIIEQVKFTLNAFDTPRSLKRKIDETEGKALLNALTKLTLGTKSYIPQDETQATQYDEIRTPDDSFIDWNKSLKELYNDIRACDPIKYPAFFYVEGEKVCIKLWRPNKPQDEEDMI